MFWTKVQMTAAVVSATVVVGVGAGVPVSMKWMAADSTVRQAPSAGSGQAQGSAEQSWPQFHGPNRDSIVPGGPKLLDTWPTNGPTLLWKTNCLPQGGVKGRYESYGPMGGDGSVTVANGRLYMRLPECVACYDITATGNSGATPPNGLPK